MQSSSLACRRLGHAAIALVVLATLAPDAHAGLKPHCRRLLISGNAGSSPNQATFQILDKNNNTLSQSCAVQPWDDESAIQYINRLVYRWQPDPENADLDNDPCTPIPPINDPAALAALGPLPTKTCVTLAGPDQPSCTIKYKVSPKETGVKKQYIEFCCYEDNADDKLCKTKLDPVDLPKPVPITVQVDTNGDLIYCPDEPCDGNCPECPIVDIGAPLMFGMRGPVEPLLGTKHLPSADGGTCRNALGASLTYYARLTSSAIADCHKSRLYGKIPAATDCNSTTDDPKTAEAFANAAARVIASTDECTDGGSPADSGYASCPAPCNAIDIGVCSAGNVGAACDSDGDCDVIPGDGRCGDWDTAGDCFVCLAENAVLTAAETTYGDTPVPPPAPVDVARCADAIGRALEKMTATLVSETTKCQKKADAGQSLPAGVRFCKDADTKGIIAGTEAASRDLIANECGGGQIAVLASICGGALDPVAVGDCVVDNAHVVNDAISATAFPETKAVCGNGIKENGEACDAGDDATCPLACLPSCQCGTLSPVAEDLSPCASSLDRYTFSVQTGDTIALQADTVDALTAADLCFGAGSGCTNGDLISGDEEIPCAFPSPNSFGCPQEALVASADGVCTIEVEECVSDCANPAQASYSLQVHVNGDNAVLQQLADDEPTP